MNACSRSLFLPLGVLLLGGCGRPTRQPGDVVFVIESNPANLDPRYATDGQSQRIDRLLFNGLVIRDSQMNLHGDLAESWDTPDPLTYVFHLKPGRRFHDGRPLSSTDVKATFDYIMNPQNQSPKHGSFRLIASIDAPDPQTVIFHLKEPYASFAWNLERSAAGIVPVGATRDFGRHPIGSGPFRLVSQSQDDAVVLERSTQTNAPHTAAASNLVPASAALDPQHAPSAPVERVTFRIVPDAIVRALELRKGSADVEVSSLSPDMIPILAKRPELQVTDRAGTNFAYLGVNFEDPLLAKKKVRRALAYAIDRQSLVKYLLHGEARLATGILPPEHWAYEPNVQTYEYDPAQAERLLDAAGFRRGADGTRLHLTLKVSTQEAARLLGAALQNEWQKIGVALEVRPLETATLFSDLAKGNFQLSYSIWVGANTDPDVFGFVFSTHKFPPEGANRGHYRNIRVDELTEAIQTETNREKRKLYCIDVQKIVAEDLPYISLWYVDVVSVHRRDLDVDLTPTGDYDFLMR
jgi:ABC-type transport system substrate-binding protein